jgi:hypothetical protein
MPGKNELISLFKELDDLYIQLTMCPFIKGGFDAKDRDVVIREFTDALNTVFSHRANNFSVFNAYRLIVNTGDLMETQRFLRGRAGNGVGAMLFAGSNRVISQLLGISDEYHLVVNKDEGGRKFGILLRGSMPLVKQERFNDAPAVERKEKQRGRRGGRGRAVRTDREFEQRERRVSNGKINGPSEGKKEDYSDLLDTVNA